MRNRRLLKNIMFGTFVLFVLFIFSGCKEAKNAKEISNPKKAEVLIEKIVEKSELASFTISCGSGCAMIYHEQNTTSNEVTFKVETYINEVLSDENLETYVIVCDGIGNAVKVYFKGDKDNILKSELPMLREEFKKFGDSFCSKKYKIQN